MFLYKERILPNEVFGPYRDLSLHSRTLLKIGLLLKEIKKINKLIWNNCNNVYLFMTFDKN